MCEIIYFGKNNVGKVYVCATHELRFVVTWRSMDEGTRTEAPTTCPEGEASGKVEEATGDSPVTRALAAACKGE